MSTGIGAGISSVFDLKPGASAPVYACPTQYSLELDGLTEYGLLLNGAPALGGGFGNFTISFWMKTPDSTGGGVNQRIFQKIQGSSGISWSLYITPTGKIQWISSGGTNSWNDGFPEVIIPNDTWIFIAYSVDRSDKASYSANAGTFYGKDISGNTAFDLSGGTNFYLGRTGGGQYFEGNLCHMSIWDTNLDQTQLAELYNNTAGKCYASDFSFSSNLQNYWPCFNPGGTYTDPLTDTVGGANIPLINTTASNVSTDHPL